MNDFFYFEFIFEFEQTQPKVKTRKTPKTCLLWQNGSGIKKITINICNYAST
jgi:hypothetical protein